MIKSKLTRRSNAEIQASARVDQTFPSDPLNTYRRYTYAFLGTREDGDEARTGLPGSLGSIEEPSGAFTAQLPDVKCIFWAPVPDRHVDVNLEPRSSRQRSYSLRDPVIGKSFDGEFATRWRKRFGSNSA